MPYMNLPNILIAGNCVTDLIFKGKVLDKRAVGNRLSLAFGGKYVVDELYQCNGGGGANTAVSLARQGFNTYLWARLGNDAFGQQALINLEKEKINTSLITFDAKRTPLSAVLLTKNGERTIITYRSNADQLEFTERVKKLMKNCQWFTLFSLAYCPKENKIAFFKEAKKNGQKVFLSLHGKEYYKGYDYLKEYLTYTDALHLNAHELANIFKQKVENLNLLKTNFSIKLNIPLLLVSYDVKGGFAYTKDRIVHQPIFKPKKLVDTTGAGDAFASGFLGEYIKTCSLEKALIFAAQNAKSEIEVLGAQNGLLRKKN